MTQPEVQPATIQEAAVSLDAVSKSYGDHAAVRDLSLEIGKGEFFTLLGPSGCGKTTTLRMVGGFIMPDAGRILIDGRDVTRDPPNRRPSNMVFQQYALFPHLTVYDNVAFGPVEAKAERRDVERRVGEALELVHLAEYAKRKPHELSGGQQQRVAVARALVNHPSVLLLDEPLGALDLKMRKAMQFELKRIQREVGITFVYVTHDQEEALTMSDRIAVMRDGVAEQVGAPIDIYDRPANLFVAGFIGETNVVPTTVVEVRDGEAAVRLPGGDTVTVPADGPLVVGEPAAVLIRPEALRIGTAREATGQRHQLVGRVVEAVFQGPLIRSVVALADGTEIVVASSRDDGAVPTPGESLAVSWSPQDARLLPGERPTTGGKG